MPARTASLSLRWISGAEELAKEEGQ